MALYYRQITATGFGFSWCPNPSGISGICTVQSALPAEAPFDSPSPPPSLPSPPQIINWLHGIAWLKFLVFRFWLASYQNSDILLRATHRVSPAKNKHLLDYLDCLGGTELKLIGSIQWHARGTGNNNNAVRQSLNKVPVLYSFICCYLLAYSVNKLTCVSCVCNGYYTVWPISITFPLNLKGGKHALQSAITQHEKRNKCYIQFA